jgi:hypothetical protein
MTVILNNVLLSPNGKIDLIQEQLGTLELEAEVLVDENGDFGTWTHPDSGLVSPIADAYYNGTGIVYFRETAEDDWRDVGNTPSFEFSPKVTRFDHWKTRGGKRVKDKSFVKETTATVKVVLDEYTAENLRLAIMGTFA